MEAVRKFAPGKGRGSKKEESMGDMFNEFFKGARGSGDVLGGPRRSVDSTPPDSPSPFCFPPPHPLGDLPAKLATMIGLLVLSRVGVYVPLDGVDTQSFAASLQQGGVLGYVDTLSGGSISKLGVFSLGIVPYINASIVMQLLATSIPQLQKLQKEEGEAGRRQYKQYERLAALAFAFAQAFGQVGVGRGAPRVGSPFAYRHWGRQLGGPP